MSVLPPPRHRAPGSPVPPRAAVRAGADLRLLRAAVFTAVCVLLSAGGHALASCAPVPLWTLGLGGVAVFAVVMALAGRERSLPGIAAGLAVGQLGLHALFGLGQHGSVAVAERAGADGRVIALAEKMVCNSGAGRLDAAEAYRIVRGAGIDPATNPALAGHGGAGGGRLTQAWLPGPASHGSVWHSLLPSPGMVLGHLLAALAAGWLLRRGEVALWRLVRLSADRVRVPSLRAALRLVRALRAGLPGQAPPAGRRARRGAGRDEPDPGALVLQHSVIRRGPPGFGLAA
ncbi:hypothetical protein [Streptomyces sp. NPDC018031]|uniref:hypothetical protein n=1 Tax=Streptomyces sp. NPDC018031 TaxID=3365033 RepID=UPI0037B2BEB9